MNVVERYGKRNSSKQEPQMPAPLPPAAPHDQAAKALAFVTGLNDEVAMLREENGRLRADLNLALMRCRDAERAMRDMDGDLERYRRYSITVKTQLALVVDIALKANDAACDAVHNPAPMPDDQAEQMIQDTERELRELAADKVVEQINK
jgi:hypothetical protein